MTSRLVTKTLELLDSREYRVTLTRISEETKIPLGWLKRLQQRKIAEPSCPRIERLYEHLAGRQLEL